MKSFDSFLEHQITEAVSHAVCANIVVTLTMPAAEAFVYDAYAYASHIMYSLCMHHLVDSPVSF